jgi:mono/diheme cytochrome c family protein
MASSSCLGCASLYLAFAASALLAGCGTEPLRDAPSAAPSTGPRADAAADAGPPAAVVAGAGLPAADPGVVLPAGTGREILLAKCLGCHDLGGLDLFQAFYRRDDWRALVQTMVTHGAAVDELEVEVLTEYLATYFGPPE